MSTSVSKLQSEPETKSEFARENMVGVMRGEEEVRDSLAFSTRYISIRLLMLLLFPFFLFSAQTKPKLQDCFSPCS